jgi:hypothetical protein
MEYRTFTAELLPMPGAHQKKAEPAGSALNLRHVAYIPQASIILSAVAFNMVSLI